MNIKLHYLADGHQRISTDPENADYKLEYHIGDPDERTRITLHPKKPLTLISCSIEQPYRLAPGSQIFVNGYQSWTDTREYDRVERLHNMNLVSKGVKDRFHFEAYGDAWFLKYKWDVVHGFTFAYVKTPDGRADFYGSYNEANAYLILAFHKRNHTLTLRSDCQYLQTDQPFVLYDFVHDQGDVRTVLKRYFSRYGTCEAPAIRGYTSWYLDYQDISEAKILNTLEHVDSENFDLFQIDDGYETFIGDWLEIDPVKFPNGLAHIVDRIHAKGLKAGIWLAPFVCEIKSRLYREHPDWLYRENGKEVFAGCNWSGQVVLDIRKDEVQDYIKQSLEYYKEIGIDFFKLDFLYAAGLVHEGRGLTRAQIMRISMEGLRRILEGRQILGCGVPLSSAFNLVDYCRIGPDVSLKFDDVFYMRPMHRERISTKVTIPNTIYRSCMDGTVFRCDPDVFLLRDNNIDLSKEQRKALVMLNHLCGAVYMTSDDVGDYDEEKKTLLRQAQQLSRAQITGIKKNRNVITVQYELDGTASSLRYDMQRGVLV